MKNFFRFLRGKERKTDLVSEFFLRTSKKEKERVLLEVAKQASEDQRKLLREYEKKMHAMGAR